MLRTLFVCALTLGGVTAAACNTRNKIGFHLGPGGNQNGIQTYMSKLDAAKIPMFLKSVDAYGTISQGVALKKASGVPHVFVWRNTNLDVPDYSLNATAAADKHWAANMAQLPTGFDKDDVWLELINEPDQSKCEWLGEFGLRSAQLALQNGYRITMFSFATGNPPVPDCWEEPSMLSYLKTAEKYPTQLGVALHEYSLTLDITHEYPWLVGRFQFLYQVCDKYGIKYPTTHFTEWGWEAFHVPGASDAVSQVDEMMTMAYHNYSSIEGGAIWYLGPGFNGIANQADLIVEPLTEFTLGKTYPPCEH